MLYFKKILQPLGVLSALTLLAGCTVQPLHSGSGVRGVNNAKIEQKASHIIIDEAKDRETQILRNQLIYLLASTSNAQGMEGAQAPYQLSLEAMTQTIATVQIDVGDRTDRAGRPSAGTVRARASYVLRDAQGNVVVKGQRSMSAPFDRPRQEYANLSAEEDAKRRALEELANQIALVLARDISKH